MSRIVVQLCDFNQIQMSNIERIMHSLYPDVLIVKRDCLLFCGMCGRNPFAIVNGKRIFAKTIDECIELIKESIEEGNIVRT